MRAKKMQAHRVPDGRLGIPSGNGACSALYYTGTPRDNAYPFVHAHACQC
ncbi:MAG TPA: hypothetical protein VGO91_18845 [Pyrinomonadaceae bacterium]|nr:hypothetical protein [Pyrinomonadaceae bacterium]